VLQSSKKPTNGLLFLGHTKLEELTALLKDLDLLKVSGQVDKDSEAVGLRLEELQKIGQADLTVIVE